MQRVNLGATELDRHFKGRTAALATTASSVNRRFENNNYIRERGQFERRYGGPIDSTLIKLPYGIKTAEESRTTAITTYFHSYSFVPGGAVPLHPPLHTAGPGVSNHLLGHQTCNFACTCTCTCTASIVTAAAAAAANANAAVAVAAPQHPPPLHQHHRALGTATATVLLQPVDHIKDAMVSDLFISINYRSFSFTIYIQSFHSKRSRLRKGASYAGMG